MVEFELCLFPRSDDNVRVVVELADEKFDEAAVESWDAAPHAVALIGVLLLEPERLGEVCVLHSFGRADSFDGYFLMLLCTTASARS